MIIVLSGPPRSGKTSIAIELEKHFAPKSKILGVDFLNETFPELAPGVGLRPGFDDPDKVFVAESVYLALFHLLAAYDRIGFTVICDIGQYRMFDESEQILSEAKVVRIGVTCSEEEYFRRREATGYPVELEKIQAWEKAVISGRSFDLLINTTSSRPEESALNIRKLFWLDE